VNEFFLIAGDFLYSTTSGPALGPTAYPVATQGSSPEVKWSEGKADPSPPPSDEVKNGEAIAPYLYHNDRNLNVLCVLSKRNNTENITAYFLRGFK
jgi:hypothetical protein